MKALYEILGLLLVLAISLIIGWAFQIKSRIATGALSSMILILVAIGLIFLPFSTVLLLLAGLVLIAFIVVRPYQRRHPSVEGEWIPTVGDQAIVMMNEELLRCNVMNVDNDGWITIDTVEGCAPSDSFLLPINRVRRAHTRK